MASRDELQPPTVLHIITGLELGGAERTLASLVTAPDQAIRHEVCSLLSGGAFAATIRQAGVPLIELGLSRDWPSPMGLLRLAAEIRRRRPGIVQGWLYHGDLAALAAVTLAGRRRRTTVLWNLQGSGLDFSRYRRRLRAIARICALLSPRPDCILSNCAAGLAAHRQHGYRPSRCEIIAPGIDTTSFRPDPTARAALRAELGLAAETPLLIHAARNDAMKDHATAAAALALLPDIHMVAVGSRTDRLPPAPRLHRLGERRDMPFLFAAGDLGISSSAFGEGLCNALAEGMACGLAPVATAVGDAHALVGDTGRIVPARQPAALAAAVKQLLDEPVERKQARREAARRRIVADYSLAQMVRRFGEVYGAVGRPAPAAATAG